MNATDFAMLEMNEIELAAMRQYCKRVVPRLMWSADERATLANIDGLTTEGIFAVLARACSAFTARRMREDMPVPEVLMRNAMYTCFVVYEMTSHVKHLNARIDGYMKVLARLAADHDISIPVPGTTTPPGCPTPVKKRRADVEPVMPTPTKK